MIKITAQNKEGVQCTATFTKREWDGMFPVTRVLAIHEQCRDVLKGAPFDVLYETLIGE